MNSTYTYPKDILLTSDSGYIVVGETGNADRRMFMAKFNDFGDTVYTRDFGGGGARSICAAPDSGFMITGWEDYGSYADVIAIRTDAQGDSLWIKRYRDLENHSIGYDVDATSDGGYIIAGVTGSCGPFAGYGLCNNVRVIKIEPDSLVYCCVNRGNVDDLVGPAGPVDVSDMTYLVAYLYTDGQPPPCEEEGNVDGQFWAGPIDIADLTYLVAYLFTGGPPPPPCP